MIKKFAFGVTMVALALVVVATPASAQTVSELQAMIAQLQAQIAALAGGSTGTPAATTFTRDLTIGSSGADVTALQNWLISKGYSIPAGATGYFGAQTQAAVRAYQGASGITPASGYFGPLTRASVNSMQAPVTGGTTGGSTTTGSTTLQGGAGDITVTERSSGVENEVMEGEEEVPVLGFEIEAEGSDIAVTSVRVEFEHEGSGSDRLDRYVDEVLVMMGNKVIGSADVDDFNESSDVYSRNIPVNAVVDEDETERFYVAVTAANNIDSDDLSEDWEVALGQIRFEDATGAILTDGTGTGVGGPISETFTFEDLSTAGDVELTVNEDDDSVNRSHTVAVDDSSDTDDVEILSFTIEAEGSDLSLEAMKFAIVSSGAGVTEIANDFRLMMDGEEIGTVTIDRDNDNGSDGFASSTDTTVWVRVTDIDDDEVVVDEGDEVSFTLVADINDIDGAFASGDSFTSVTLDAADITAEDEDGDAVTDLNGSATSETIRFQSSGVSADNVTSSADPFLGLDSTSSDDQGKFTMTFDVEAFKKTAWIALTAASSTSADSSNVGVAFYIEDASTGASVGTGTTTSATLRRVSGGSESGGYVRINDGQTARFELTVYYDAAAAGSYRVQIDSIGFNQSSGAAADQEYDVLPASDFESASTLIQN